MLLQGKENGEEDYEAPSVDEGRRADTQDARARENEDNGDRRKLNRSVRATYQKALGLARKKRRA
jgi:hypothetical protein